MLFVELIAGDAKMREEIAAIELPNLQECYE
jgi:hypothetical protein